MNKEILESLLRCYVELNKLHAEPGERCHMLAYSLDFIKNMIKRTIKDIKQ